MDLKDEWFNLAGKYCQRAEIIKAVWYDIEKAYSSSHRHYHNLGHIEEMLSVLSYVKSSMHDPDAIWFATFFHDMVYVAGSSVNEERSRDLGRECLHYLGVSEAMQQIVDRLIILTKVHPVDSDLTLDEQLFVDADLAILGMNPERYSRYAEAVRKEYSIFPDFIYYKGRKKVLKGFLENTVIYRTRELRSCYEARARVNISEELKQLSA